MLSAVAFIALFFGWLNHLVHGFFGVFTSLLVGILLVDFLIHLFVSIVDRLLGCVFGILRLLLILLLLILVVVIVAWIAGVAVAAGWSGIEDNPTEVIDVSFGPSVGNVADLDRFLSIAGSDGLPALGITGRHAHASK